ncbi:hypothetical protein GCM10010244_56390 [Streptomyces coeruleorubidus]|nr:hypothetical protein GCM10010244_56390 [Streptomyces bellus]
MPSTARRWHPIQAVNAYAIRLVWLRDHREGTWLTVPWRLLSSTRDPIRRAGGSLDDEKQRFSGGSGGTARAGCRWLRAAARCRSVNAPCAARPKPGTKALATGAGCGPRPAVAEYRQAPSVLALFSYSYGQVACSTTHALTTEARMRPPLTGNGSR